MCSSGMCMLSNKELRLGGDNKYIANIVCVCNVPFTEHKQTPIIHKPSVKGALYLDRFFYTVLYVQQPLPDC